MNILIKLMSIVSLVIAPTLAKLHHDKIVANRKAQIETMTQMSKDNTINEDKNDNKTHTISSVPAVKTP